MSDLSSESDSPTEVSEPRLVDYDPRPMRETVRGRLAAALLFLLALLTLSLVVTVAAGWRTWDELEGIATLTYGPVVSLTATMLGFYYGEQRR